LERCELGALSPEEIGLATLRAGIYSVRLR
jgi:hypothetical protein